MQSYSLALVLGWFLIIMSDFNQKFWCLWYLYLIDFHFGMYVNKLKGFIVAKLKVAVTATIINASSRTPGRWLSFWQVCPRLKLRCLPCPRPELQCPPCPRPEPRCLPCPRPELRSYDVNHAPAVRDDVAHCVLAARIPFHSSVWRPSMSTPAIS